MVPMWMGRRWRNRSSMGSSNSRTEAGVPRMQDPPFSSKTKTGRTVSESLWGYAVGQDVFNRLKDLRLLEGLGNHAIDAAAVQAVFVQFPGPTRD